MKIITSIKDMQRYAQQLKSEGKSIGHVPTMGYLHEGHLRLVHEAKKDNGVLVMSIFVNPLQFGPNEDFDKYPRDFERDERLAENAGVNVIFYPGAEDMYPSKVLSVTVKVNDRVDVLCGKSREGHFDGVATVLVKLFNIVMPDKAYFGMKDAQQVAVVKAVVEDFNIPVEIVPVKTVREEDGLAKSSRNVNLTGQERQQAPAIYESLQLAEKAITNGEYNLNQIKNKVKDHILTNTDGKIDYVEIYSYPELKPVESMRGDIIVAAAVRFANARLIDNITLSL
jgi:pantoate--beta-alanine ligase